MSSGGPDPPIWRKAYLAASEQVYCLWLVLSAAVPVVIDALLAPWRRGQDRLPTNVRELHDVHVYSALVGRQVHRVLRNLGQEQLANSSGRDWLRIEYADGSADNVFVKTAAGSFFTNAMMSLFGVYRNDVNTMREGLVSAVRPPIRTPRVHCAKWSPSRFVVVLDDLTRGTAAVRFPNVWMDPPCSLDLAKSVLTTLAKLHAHYLERPPACIWNDATRPYFGKVVGMLTFDKILRKLPDVVSPSARRAFTTALWHYDTLRAEWSSAWPQTMCHGDAHIGNMYIDSSGEVGLIDFQCICQEHPMRDVTYFLACTYPQSRIAADERTLLEFYLAQLTKFARQRDPSLALPTLEDCIEQQRLHVFYAMYAFVFSGGVPDTAKLMDLETMARVSIGRVAATLDRIGAEQALHKLLERQRKRKEL